uniref:Olfactory receptor n=1 Tax=Leptobrachium leishanense TaxID=445787 RepID=A0A8C5M5L0_9ANUR
IPLYKQTIKQNLEDNIPTPIYKVHLHCFGCVFSRQGGIVHRKLLTMRHENSTEVTEFILLGLISDPSIEIVLFLVFLIIYTATVTCNVLLIVAVKSDNRLHSSMYVFLSSLSFIDICYTTIIVPKMLVDFLVSRKRIPYTVCMVQIYFYLLLGQSECILLAFMAYDRYIAICLPLRYNTFMSIPNCTRMIAVAWMTGGVVSTVDIVFQHRLTFCGPNVIDHFFCEAPSLMQLACGDISDNNIVMLVGSTLLIFFPVSLILFSYGQIVICLVRIRSGRLKSFSTCLSHLIVVVLFFGTITFMYMRPRRPVKDATDKMVSVFYTIVTPMLNPLIYSLRNKVVKQSLRRLGRCIFI